jgi:hypothetical protein
VCSAPVRVCCAPSCQPPQRSQLQLSARAALRWLRPLMFAPAYVCACHVLCRCSAKTTCFLATAPPPSGKCENMTATASVHTPGTLSGTAYDSINQIHFARETSKRAASLVVCALHGGAALAPSCLKRTAAADRRHICSRRRPRHCRHVLSRAPLQVPRPHVSQLLYTPMCNLMPHVVGSEGSSVARVHAKCVLLIL